MCGICVEAVGAAATVTIMALPFRARIRRWLSDTRPRLCEGPCGWTVRGVALESGRTSYPWDGVGTDPNRPVWLCRPCAAEHHEYWDERWSEYNSDRL